MTTAEELEEALTEYARADRRVDSLGAWLGRNALFATLCIPATALVWWMQGSFCAWVFSTIVWAWSVPFAGVALALHTHHLTRRTRAHRRALDVVYKKAARGEFNDLKARFDEVCA